MLLSIKRDNYWMEKALQLATNAAAAQEVPVGAVLVLDDQVIGEGSNCPISSQDPTAHAEILALRSAAKYLANYRLLNSTLYVTLEPCLMCAGAIIHARIHRLVYGAADSKTGVVTTQLQILNHTFLNHRVNITQGVLADRCGHVLSEFFKKKRSKN